MSEKDLLAQVFNLDEMLAYQDGSVVSRTLINKNIGTGRLRYSLLIKGRD
jgi:hypothetical protein